MKKWNETKENQIIHCNNCYINSFSDLKRWIARCTTLCDKVCQWLATVQWFSLGPPVSSTDKIDCHDMTEILLKVVLNTIKQTNKTEKMNQ